MARFLCTVAIENENGDPALEVTEYGTAASLMAYVHETCLDDDPEVQGSVARLAEWVMGNPTGTLMVTSEAGPIATVTVQEPERAEFVLPEPTPRGEDTLASFLWDVAVTAFESPYGEWFRVRRARADGVIDPWDDEDSEDGEDDAAPALLPWYHEDGKKTEGWAATVYFLPDGEADPAYPPKIVSADTLRGAFDRLVTRTPEQLSLHPRYIGQLLGAFFALEAGDIDAELADYLLQIAVCGEVVCS